MYAKRPVAGRHSTQHCIARHSMADAFSCFQRDDLWEALARHPDTRPHVADSGFHAAVERLRQGSDQQAMAAEALKDPRVMQAVAALQGWGLDVSEADIKHAESVGDVKKRDAVQMGDLEVACKHTTVNAAKAAGNELFKGRQFSKALACYRHALQLQCQEAVGEAAGEAAVAARGAVSSTLSSNAAATLLKLQRPKEALAACEDALRSAPPGSDLRKVYFRKAQALEILHDYGPSYWCVRQLPALECGAESCEEAMQRHASSFVSFPRRCSPSGSCR